LKDFDGSLPTEEQMPLFYKPRSRANSLANPYKKRVLLYPTPYPKNLRITQKENILVHEAL
jgi:hypothetical protein